MSKSTLKEFMPEQVRRTLGDAPTWHSNCLAATGKKAKDGTVTGGTARPGKTARDKKPRNA
jgi:hypothetical protein